MTKNDITGMAAAAAILRSAVQEWTDWNTIATRAWFFVVAHAYAQSLRVVVGIAAALRYEPAKGSALDIPVIREGGEGRALGWL